MHCASVDIEYGTSTHVIVLYITVGSGRDRHTLPKPSYICTKRKGMMGKVFGATRGQLNARLRQF